MPAGGLSFMFPDTTLMAERGLTAELCSLAVLYQEL